MRTMKLWVILAAQFTLWGQAPNQLQPARANQVLATLTVKEGVTRDQIVKVMNSEVKATVRLYLDGKIQQWFARGDNKGVVFIMNCADAAEAKAITDTLPLVKENFAEFTFMAIGPLTPLRFLLAQPE